MPPIGQTSTSLLAKVVQATNHLGVFLASGVAANTQLIGTVLSAYLSMQQGGEEGPSLEVLAKK